MNISVVIPVYKNKALFLTNLAQNYTYIKDNQIIIVDDKSDENLKEDIEKIYKEIVVIENKKNLGFAESVNIGFAKAQNPYVLLLNSDVKLNNDSYKRSIDLFKKNEKLFAIGFLQLERDGRKVGKNKLFFKRGLIHHSKSDDLDFGLTAWAEGGACMIDKEKFDLLNGFDKLYKPFYWEDIDLSYRAYKRGWEVYFDPEIKAEHHHESTISKYYENSYIKKIAYRNQLIFFWKNITDRNLIFKNIFYLPLNMLYSVSGFLLALANLPKIIRSRLVTMKINKLKDREILKLFKNEISE